ncbi:MAG: HPr-rel-A system PqqD family peptide chaperone [Hyphomicrobiales bacterium]|nr:HPr-rel-A system PqqD family peptide chaperone [Hyphomicrobiales bacterium]
MTHHLSRRLWDGECVVYDDQSGDTHHLDPLATSALLLFAAAPLSDKELAARMAELLEAPEDNELLDWCQRTIFRFRMTNLVAEVEI